uniref:Uncharacterized protein n=1 Tax=Sphaerodactylus townsendi TaxID=933632 RepID=A0ACB8FKN7_9SAUR
MLRGAPLTMEVMRYQFSRSANSSEERVLTHYSEVSLLLEDRPDFPEELQGAKKGMLYLTQYKMIFQHKDKGSTIIRFPLQLLEDCLLEDEPGSKPQCIKGTLTSGRGAVSFKLTFCHGAATECLSMIKDLSEADMLREGRNLQEYPTASIYTYAHPGAPRSALSEKLLLLRSQVPSTRSHCGRPHTLAHRTSPLLILKCKRHPCEGTKDQKSKRAAAIAEGNKSRIKWAGRTKDRPAQKGAVRTRISFKCVNS